MKRWAWILGAIGILLFFSGAGTQVEELKPVSLLCVRKEAGEVCLETDGGDLGRGKDFSSAVGDLGLSSAGTVFLDTTEYVVLEEQGAECLKDLYEVLRPAAEVCLGVGNLSPETAAAYLKAHSPEVTLGELRTGEGKLPLLTVREGRYYIVGTETDR